MLVGNWIGSADLSASLSSLSNFFFSLFAIVLLALTSSSSFLMAARGSANTFVCGSIAAITKEILAATASYSAKFLNPCFLVTALRSTSYLDNPEVLCDSETWDRPGFTLVLSWLAQKWLQKCHKLAPRGNKNPKQHLTKEQQKACLAAAE